MKRSEKRENDTRKWIELKNRILISGGVLWVVTLLLLFFTTKKEDIFSGYLTEISSGLFCGILVTLVWGFVLDKINDDNNKILIDNFVSILDEKSKGLKLVNAEDAFLLAELYVRDCDEIRVIGAAQQDHTKQTVRDAIDKYLEATIQRVKKNKLLVYKRITNINVNENFKKHLKNLFEANKKNNGENIQMLLYNDFTPFYTYLLIDNKFMLLSINHPSKSEDYCPYCLISENREVIEQFKNQFNLIFQREKNKNTLVKDLKSFSKSQDFDKKIFKLVEEITTKLGQLPYEAMNFQNLINNDLSYLKSNIDKIDQQKLIFNHKLYEGNLLHIYGNLLNDLNEGDKYNTVTFFEFWNSILVDGKRIRKFIGANEEALKKGAKINRTLMIDESELERVLKKNFSITNSSQVDQKELNDLIYLTVLRVGIKENIKILMENPENYIFKILISNDFSKAKRNYYNFTIIEKTNPNNTKILCLPSSDDTEILYVVNNEDSANKKSFDHKQKILKEIMATPNEVDNRRFLPFFKSINEVFFSDLAKVEKVLNFKSTDSPK